MSERVSRRRFITVTTVAATTVACGGTNNVQDVSDVPDVQDAMGDAPAHDASDSDTALDAQDSDSSGFDAADGDDSGADGAADAGDLDPSAIAEDGVSFPLGIMAGDAESDRVVVWTRYVGTRTLVLRVIEMEGTTIRRIAFERDVAPGTDGFTHVDVNALMPGTRYRYAFLVREGPAFVARSAIGRFRTAIASDALEVVTFAGTSCTHQRARPFPVLQHASSRSDLDFFVHLGDHTYADGATSLADFRVKYAENWTASGMKNLHASVGLYCTLDDHEVDNDFNPETISALTLTNARTAYFEHRAQRRDSTAPGRIWRSFRWGRTLEIFMLDCRSERRPSTRGSAGATYVSRAQMDWLKAGLMASTAAFKFIGNSVPITNFPLIFDVAAGDRWEGYDAQRTEILSFITSNSIRNVWWISGDFHLATVATLEPSGPYAAMREILVGPGGNNANLLHATLARPQFEWATGESNYTVFRVDPMAASVEVTYHSGSGAILFTRRFMA